ncbi:protein serine/threonine kinase [Cavenderia fasciculata]|uniref:non-specific serine/threonine protein kinase n=1 Tax=Cavenderia fasciculata TaxID=261658 RepID=F4PNQ0_CACFS|nr:protein serine/threonine kinase [Cavenderia fasciculata]EGG23103.1 protein serine/threonine kinase [Cavenderia fasciculata]|eukprot:XP_004360954.1 protein serine/threonine kinase [Cavenderia fasciculata]
MGAEYVFVSPESRMSLSTTVETSHSNMGDEDSANLVSVTVSATATGMHNNTASFSDSDIVTSSSMCSSTTMMAINTKSSSNAVGMTPDIGTHYSDNDNNDHHHHHLHLRDHNHHGNDNHHNNNDDTSSSSSSSNEHEHDDHHHHHHDSQQQNIHQQQQVMDNQDFSKLRNLTISKKFLDEINSSSKGSEPATNKPISLNMSRVFDHHHDNDDDDEAIKTMVEEEELETPPQSLDEILQEFKEIYNYLYVGDLNKLFGLRSIQMNDNQRIRCLGFDDSIELSVHVQRYFQYQIIDFESETDILSITKQFDHFSQLILGRGRNTPVVIHDLIGYNDFFGTSQKHSHYQKVDSCTLIGDVTTYYYRNMTKRSQPHQKPAPVVEQLMPPPVQEKKDKGGFLKKLFNSSKKDKKTVEQKPRSASVALQPDQAKQIQKQYSNPTLSPDNKHTTTTTSTSSTTTTTSTAASSGQLHNNNNNNNPYEDNDDTTPNLELARDSRDDSKLPPIIASCFAELADEHKDIIKKWSLKQIEIDYHWEITLCLLHFQTKLRFYSSQQKFAEANSRKDRRRSDKRQAYLDGGAGKTPLVGGGVGTLPPGVVSRIPLTDYELPRNIDSKLINIVPTPFSKKSLDHLAKKVSSSEIKKLFSIKERVGKGGFGSVYSARSNASKERIAIKKLPHKKSKERKMNTREIRVLDYCRHPNIISYHESFLVSSSDELWVSMEFMEGGTLSEASSQYPFQESNIAYVAREILVALHYLHSNGFVHRDLKSQNVMMTPSGDIKLIDFGLCASLKSGPKIRMCGSPLWMPPEQIQQTYHSFTADIWSMGVCLLELANRAHKHRKDPLRTMFMVATEGFKQPFEDPNRWSDLFHDFINLCLQFDPTKRPSALQLLAHPFISQADNKKKMAKILSSVFLQNIVGI